MKKATCTVVIDQRTGYILAATRRGTTDNWGIIGGKQDEGETLLQCAMREFFEETSYQLSSEPSYYYSDECLGDVDYDVAVYVVNDPKDVVAIMGLYQNGPVEVEPGILVGFVPFTKVMQGAFGEFNTRLLNRIIRDFSLTYYTNI